MIKLEADVSFASTIPSNADVRREFTAAMKIWVADIVRKAKDNLSGRMLRSRSGEGVRSVKGRVTSTQDGVRGVVGTPIFYLRILHTGFPAQELTTKKKGFTILQNGHFIRVKSIQHPGVSPRPWLQDATERSIEGGKKAFEIALRNLGKQISNG